MSMDMHLKLDGVKGESVSKGHEGDIDILAWSWGMSQSGTSHRATGAGAGKVSVQDLSFTHYVDSATPNLIQACCTGKPFKSAVLTMQKAGDKPLIYVKIELTDVMITSTSTGGSGGEDLLTENVTLNFAKFKYIYQPQDKTGAKKDGEIVTEYNIAVNA